MGVSQARDYVESLHQNPRSTLIYGKNNVTVHPVSAHRELVPDWDVNYN